MENKKALMAIIDGPPGSLFDLAGAYLPPGPHAAKGTMRMELRAVLQDTAETCRSDQLADVLARRVLALISAVNSPLRRKGRGGASKGDSNVHQHLQCIILFCLLANMPGGFDGAHTSLRAQAARAPRRWRRIRAACLPGRCVHA